jgi:5-methyltetrahydrofolate--homocysteine methyltransferase
MHPIISDLLKDGPVITDGAWGTQLQAAGLPVADLADIWNLTRPEIVESVARAYVDAGSRIILTNTFRATRLVLAAHGLDDRARDVNREGARISVRAAADKALVFGSIGPSGKMLLLGDVTEEELLAAFTEQAQALADGGAHGLVLETMSDLAEARLAIAAARTTSLPVVACMVFDSGKNKDRTMTGTTPEEAAAELAAAGADVIGANCGDGIDNYISVCARLQSASDRPVWIKPNAGLPEIQDGAIVYRSRPEEFAQRLQALIQAGADFIGGCCGTTPDFIAALSNGLDQHATK